jgi:hypothetical protein
MSDSVRHRVVQLGCALPEVIADESHEPHVAFRVGSKNFAWYVENEHGDCRVALLARVPPGENAALVATDGERFALPKYVARHGYVSYYLDLPHRPVDWAEVTELLADSYRLQAPQATRPAAGRSREIDWCARAAGAILLT